MDNLQELNNVRFNEVMEKVSQVLAQELEPYIQDRYVDLANNIISNIDVDKVNIKHEIESIWETLGTLGSSLNERELLKDLTTNQSGIIYGTLLTIIPKLFTIAILLRKDTDDNTLFDKILQNINNRVSKKEIDFTNFFI
jgi:hypothetical protein